MAGSEYSSTVQGMICPQCEDELTSALLHTRGVIKAEASYRKARVTLEYDPELISIQEIEAALEKIGYPSGGSGKEGFVSDIVSLAAVIALYFLIPALTGLVNIPAVENSTSLLSLFFIGVLTGVHCIGMCGGIMLSQKNALVYNGARIAAYTIAGGIFGAFGAALVYDDQTKSMLLTVCGILVVLAGLLMWGVPFLRRIAPAFVKPCSFRRGPLITGLLTGLMPCGAMSAVWMLSAASGSALKGAGIMLAFGLGTCIFMLLFGFFGVLIPKKYNRFLLRGSSVFIVALGLILISKGLL